MICFNTNVTTVFTITGGWLVFNGWAFYPPAGEWLNLALAAFLLAAIITRIYNECKDHPKRNFTHPLRRRIYGDLEI